MTTTTAPERTAVPVPRTSLPYRQSLGRVIRGEWIKPRTLRSTWIGMGSVVLLLVGLAAISAAVFTSSSGTRDNDGPFSGSDPLSIVLVGADFAVLVIGVLGCLAGAREYGSRMIATTVAAVPRRWWVVVSKAVVVTAVMAATVLIGVFGAFYVGMAVLSSGDSPTTSLADDGVLRSLLGMAGYLTAIGLIGLGLGVLLRSVAGSIGAVVAGVLILPALAGALLPASWDTALQYLPSSAAAAFTTVQPAGDAVLDAGAGALVLVAWVVVALGAAALAITRRDV